MKFGTSSTGFKYLLPDSTIKYQGLGVLAVTGYLSDKEKVLVQLQVEVRVRDAGSIPV